MMSRITESLYGKYGITLNEEDYEISNKGYTKADRKKVKKLLSTKKGKACGDKKELDEAINPELMTIYDEFDFEDDELPEVRKWLKDDYDVDLVSAKTNNHGTKDVVLQGTKENLLKSYLDEYDIEDVKDWHPELFESLEESCNKKSVDEECDKKSLSEDANNDDDFHIYLENRIDELFADLENAGVSKADIRDAISYYISFI